MYLLLRYVSISRQAVLRKQFFIKVKSLFEPLHSYRTHLEKCLLYEIKFFFAVLNEMNVAKLQLFCNATPVVKFIEKSRIS